MYEVDNTVHNSSQNEKIENFEKMVIREAEHIKPVLRELFLRRFLSGADDCGDFFNRCFEAFDINYSAPVRMLIIQPEIGQSDEELTFLQNRISVIMSDKETLLNTALKGHILIITDILEKNRILSLLEKIRTAVRRHCGCDMMAVCSDVLEMSAAPKRYGKLTTCLDGLFYANGAKILYESDANEGRTLESEPDYAAFEACLKAGNADGAKDFLNGFFSLVERVRPSSEIAKKYCGGLYVCVMRCCGTDRLTGYFSGMNEIVQAGSFGVVKRLMYEAAAEVASENKPRDTKIYSSLIKDTIETIDKNIENENLSLRWLAGTILYTNVDYLGKLFKKETGKNFSHYVMEKRMEMAKALILEGKKDRIYEVAEKVGYGSNSQYFSQVFKKYTGVSPLEYKEFARLTRQKAKE